MTIWLRYPSLWTWPRTNWVADTMLYSQWSLLGHQLTVLGIYLCDLALHFFRMSSFPRRLLRPSCKQNLGRITLGALQTCLGPVWILEQRSPGLKPGLSYINSWNVKCKDKNFEREEQLLLTGKVKEDIRQVNRERDQLQEQGHRVSMSTVFGDSGQKAYCGE